MKLTEQILSALGGDTDKSFTVIIGFGAYFKGVRAVEEYSPRQIILLAFNKRLKVTGENLAIGEYFQGDAFISGEIKVVEVE